METTIEVVPRRGAPRGEASGNRFVFSGFDDGLRAVLDIELAEDVMGVPFHRADRQHEVSWPNCTSVQE